MNTTIRLNDYSTVPLYNIKAVVQATGISPSTLRAWERRYNICQPERSDSGYRLYSDRDVAVIRWLKAQVDAGMAISQAAAWLESLSQDGADEHAGVLPARAIVSAELQSESTPTRNGVRSPDLLRAELSDALVAFEEDRADRVLAEAFALYPIEVVGDEVIAPVLVDLGERWHRGELSITTEHFATGYLIQRLTALLRSSPNAEGRTSIWIGCAPGELHEAGAVLLALFLRRTGYVIHYLGQNLHASDLVEEVVRLKPQVLLLSATTPEAVAGLRKIAVALAADERSRTLLGFGGRAFVADPELRNQIDGIYLGDSAHEAVGTLRSLLLEPRPPSERPRNGAVHNLQPFS